MLCCNCNRSVYEYSTTSHHCDSLTAYNNTKPYRPIELDEDIALEPFTKRCYNFGLTPELLEWVAAPRACMGAMTCVAETIKVPSSAS